MAAVVGHRHHPARAPGRAPWWLAAALLAAYPLTVLVYAYGYSLTSGLPGSRHGPQDAYRHALASGFVAYTTSPAVVQWATRIMESADDPSSVMDRHNNAIGASIGAAAESLAEIRPKVLASVQAGRVDAVDPQQITWMPPRQWGALPF